MQTKICSKCKLEKSLHDFYMDKRRGSPHHTCKICYKQMTDRWRTKNRERDLANKRIYKAKQWSNERLRNKLLQEHREYIKKHPEYNRAAVKKYNALKRGATISDSLQNLALFEKSLRENPCTYCGGPGGTIDHIMPLSRGGQHVIENMTSACQSCNSSKRDKLLKEWNKV